MDNSGNTKLKGLTWRSVIIGFILLAINIYWVTVVEVKWYTLDGTSLPLFITPIFILLLTCLVNIGWGRIAPGQNLDRSELMVIYIMTVTSCTLAGHDMLQNMFGAISHPYFLATPENKYQSFFQYLPDFLFVQNKQALADFYNGNVNPWTSGAYKWWILPLVLWGVFLMVLFSMMMATTVLLRRAWTIQEKLVFPLIQLPVAMTASGERGSLFSSRALWYGFGLAFAIGMVNGLHVLYPQMPYLAAVKQYNIANSLTTPPWNAIADTRISMYPFAIGLAFFLPLDLSFSCWFFFVARKIFQVFGRANGWDATANGFPFFPEQAAGGWIGLGLVIVLGTRQYLARIIRQIRGIEPEDEAGDVREYKIAVGVIGAGILFLIFWSHILNIQWWAAIVFFGVYFLLSLAITRVRAELGTPHEIYFVNPHNILFALVGSAGLAVPGLGLIKMNPDTMGSICTMYWFNRGMRCHPMPNMMESFKMAEYSRINHRSIIKLVMGTLLVGMVITYMANLQVTYMEGAQAKATGFKWWLGTESFRDRLGQWLNNPQRPQFIKFAYMTGGFVLVFVLKACRAAWIGWPFHPAGYALAVSYAMDYFWFTFFISWTLKVLIVRYGGMKIHNKAVPFFLGLILGDFTVGSIWGIVGPALKMTTYKIFI